MSAAGGNAAVLSKVLNDLILQWEETAAVWRDKARESFDRDVIQEIVPAGQRASNAVVEIEELVRRVRKECS